jgi:hypothetical protein
MNRALERWQVLEALFFSDFMHQPGATAPFYAPIARPELTLFSGLLKFSNGIVVSPEQAYLNGWKTA